MKPKILKIIWIAAVVSLFAAQVWFVIGTTAMFQRRMDLEAHIVLYFFFIPTTVFNLISLYLWHRKWEAKKRPGVVFIVFMTLFYLLSMYNLVTVVKFEGWLVDIVNSELKLSVSNDGRYEYQVQFVNQSNKNGYSQLYLRDIDTGEELRIKFDSSIRTLSTIAYRHEEEWYFLTSTKSENIYLLYSNPFYDYRYPDESFEINIEEQTARKLEN